MNSWVEPLATSLLRTTLVTGAAAGATVALLGLLRIRSARIHRLAWLLVIAQGWCIACYHLRIEVEPVMAPEIAAMPGEIPEISVTAEQGLPSPGTVSGTEWNLITFASTWCPAVWCLGMALLVLVGLIRYVRVFAGGRPGEEPHQPDWVAEWEEVRRESRPCRVELRTTRDLGPLVCWVPWVFVVLVPRGLWSRLAPHDRRAILWHEVAHCERGDLWKNLAVRLLALPQWFNPLVWLAVRRFEEAAEWACDEMVARREREGSTEYASALLRVADFATHVSCGAAGVSRGELTRRVTRLLHLPDKEVLEMRSLLVPGLLAAVAVAQSVRIEQVFAAPPRAEPAAAERAKLPVRAGGFTREPYYVEPPDVLLIETGELAFKAPYRLVAADRVVVRATGVDDERAPLAFTFTLDKQGEVDLGSEYGQVKLTGMSVAEAEEALRVHLGKKYPGAKVKVSLPKTPKPPEVAGRYLVGPDGRVDLGRYGTTYVAGHTLNQAKEVIETQLSKTLRDPKVTLDVINNSKKYYVILKSPAGDRVEMQPITGNETVLDALAATEIRIKQGTRLRVERVSREGTTLVLPVDYDEITKGGDTTTNYQLWSRDRLFIEMDGARQQAPPGPADSAPPSPGEATPREPKGSEEERRPIPAKSAEPVKVTVRLIADPKRKFNEQEGAPPRPLVGESKVMVNTTEIYAREGLLEMLVSQPMSTEKGQTAKFSTDIKESASATAFAIDLTAQGNGEQVEFDARTWLTVGGKPVAYSGAFALSKGQSYLVRLSPVAKQPADSEIYLMVTRESDGSDEPQRKDEQ